MQTETQSNETANPTPAKKREKKPLNGIDTPTLLATINAVGEQPELAKFKWRATNRWISGTHSRTTIESFHGAGGEHPRSAEFSYDGDHPPVLVGGDNGPTPVEMLLHALAACLTAGIGNIAAVRGIELESVESSLEGDMDLLGILGLSDQVRNGYQSIRVQFKLRGNASPDELRAVVEQSKNRSAVYDVITGRVPVEIDIDAA